MKGNGINACYMVQQIKITNKKWNKDVKNIINNKRKTKEQDLLYYTKWSFCVGWHKKQGEPTNLSPISEFVTIIIEEIYSQKIF